MKTLSFEYCYFQAFSFMFYLDIKHRDHFVVRRGWVLGFVIDIHVICHIFNIKNTNENKMKKIGIRG